MARVQSAINICWMGGRPHYVYPANSCDSNAADMDVNVWIRSPNLFPAGVTITMAGRLSIAGSISGIMLLH